MTHSNFKLRYHELVRAREIYIRVFTVHPDVKNRIKFAKFEERHGFINRARETYERAINPYGDEYSHEYDTWFDSIRMMESESDVEAIGSLYERAIDSIEEERKTVLKIH